MRVTIPPETSSVFPENAVLKLYDRRWTDDRENEPWSPAREAAARVAWSEKRWVNMETLDYDCTDDDPEWEEPQWEEYYRRVAEVRDVLPADRRISSPNPTLE